MAISKSTPYVRYKKDFTSNLHLGTIHIESEYLDRTQKTTIESIHGMTWHNKVVNENKELNLLSDTQLELTELEKQYWNTGEKRVSVDEIHTLEEVEPNEDGTYTYTVNSMEGEYIEIYDGINNITSTSDGLDGQFEIVYDTTEEDINGNIALDSIVPQYEIIDSGVGAITGAKSTGLTLVNNITEPSKEEVVAIEQQKGQYFTIENTVQGNIKSAILKGQTLVNMFGNSRKTMTPTGLYWNVGSSILNVKPNTKYFVKIKSNYRLDFKYQTPNQTIKEITDTNSQTFTFTSSSDTEIVLITRETDVKYVVDVIMLEYQDGMENWDIPYFEGMQSVKMPVLTTVGKNLFDIKGIQKHGGTGNLNVDENGVITIIGSGATTESSVYTNKTVHLKKGKQYTFSCATDGVFGMGNGTDTVEVFLMEKGGLQAIQQIHTNPRTFTCTSTGDYTLRFDVNLGTETHTFSNIQIEEGSVVTSFEPFKSNILTVNEEVELRGIDEFKDELNLLTGELTQRVGEVVLDGSENWITDINGVGVRRYYVEGIGSDLSDTISNSSSLLCDKFEASTNTWVEKNDGVQIIKSNGIYFIDSSVDSLDAFVNKLKTTNIKVQYSLIEKPVKTVDLTVQNQDGGIIPRIQTQPTITHVSTSSDGLTPVVEMSCLYDTIIKPNTTYTIKLDRPIVSDTMYLQVDLGGTMMMLDADVNAFTIKTPSTLSHSQLRLSGAGNTVKEIIVLEGNRVNDKIEYFEGMKNVENPILIVSNCPYVFGKGGRL